MAVLPEAASAKYNLVVKHTFLDFAEEPPTLRMRPRAVTDFTEGGKACFQDELDAASTAPSSNDDTASLAGSSTDQRSSLAWCDMEDVEIQSSLMLHNLPRTFSRDDLLQLIEAKGALAETRFVYLPMDSASRLCLGFAFVSLASPVAAEQLWQRLSGCQDLVQADGQSLEVSWSTPCLTVEDQVEKFRNSPLMHSSVPDEMRPIVLLEGERVPFPAPTKKLRAPRSRDHGRLQTETRKARKA